MKFTVDTDGKTILCEQAEESRVLPLYSTEAFELLSSAWLKVGWDRKYSYTFTWLGIPIIQLPEDILRIQEVIYQVRPDVIIETGVAHGGSLIFYASLCRAVGKGRVIGIDIEIRPHNRRAIEAHGLSPVITLIEGSSTAPALVDRVRSLVPSGEKVLVILDSDHSKQHVLAELEAYGPLVTPGSYIVATDGVMRDLHDAPRGRPEWERDNPVAAATEFLQKHPEFVLSRPAWLFNESHLSEAITYWPSAWLKRVC